MIDDDFFGNFFQNVSSDYGRINVHFQKGRVDFYMQVLRNQRAIEFFKKHDPFFEYNYATAEKWVHGEMHANERWLNPYQFDFEEQVDFNKYNHTADDCLMLQTRIIQTILEDFDYPDFPNAYDFDPERIIVLKQNPAHFPKDLASEDQKLLTKGLDEIQQLWTPINEKNLKTIEYGRGFRDPYAYKYFDEVDAVEQVILNQRALNAFREVELDFGDSMMPLDNQIKQFEESLTFDLAAYEANIDPTTATTFLFDADEYKRSYRAYLSLQTRVIFEIGSNWRDFDILPKTINLNDYDMNHRRLLKASMRQIRKGLKQGQYDVQNFSLLAQGIETLKANKVGFFTKPRLVERSFDTDNLSIEMDGTKDMIETIENHDKIEVGFDRQLILNQKALNAFQANNAQMMPPLEGYLMMQEISVSGSMHAKKVQLDTSKPQWINIDIYEYRRSYNDYIQLQTAVIFETAHFQKMINDLPPEIELQNYDVEKRSIAKISYKDIIQSMENGAYSADDLALLKQGFETIEAQLVPVDKPVEYVQAGFGMKNDFEM